MRRDAHGQWYFRRADGRAVPAAGYDLEDMTDDEIDVDDHGALCASAEARSDGVREMGACYHAAEVTRVPASLLTTARLPGNPAPLSLAGIEAQRGDRV